MKSIVIAALSISAALLSCSAYAQEGAVPEEFVKDVEYFIGDWTSEVKFGDRLSEGTWSAKWSAEGKCLIIHMSGVPIDQEVTEDQENAFGTGILGWDATTNSMKDLTFWSSGNTYDAHYRKTSDTTWVGEATGTVGGKEFTEKVSLTRNSDDEFVWRAYEYVLGGEKQPDIVATIRKVPPVRGRQDHEKLEEALGWLIGEWEVDGDDGPLGKWNMTFTFSWDIDGTVLDWRNDYAAEAGNWTSETRHYWDYADESVKNTTFFSWGGGPRYGGLKACGENKVVWSSNQVRKDGSTSQAELHFSLQDDGTLLFLHFGVLDDGSKRENFRFELTKK